jgi:predicted metal-dependent peptidase
MVSEAIETKLAAARTRLILDQPFLGALVLRLPLVAADPKWCRTTATDARKLYYNSAYVEALSLGATQFVLAHEALHCALSHFARRHHRLKHRWDIACDYAINPLLIQEGLSPPPGVLVEDHFAGMTAEEIYPCLDDNSDEQDTLDEHIYDREQTDTRTRDQEHRGQGDKTTRSRRDKLPRGQNRQGDANPESRGVPLPPPPLTSQEQQALMVLWQQRLAGAAQQAMQAGKLGATMARMVDFLLQPQLPWRMLLARYMTATARDDYSYIRPSGRRGDPAIFPSLRSAQINLAVALDVSGSVSEKEISEFLSEIDALRGQLRARITLLACDEMLSHDSPWLFEPWEDLELPRELHGGGGTSFVPVFKWVASQDTSPDLLIYFTDAQGVFPHGPPSYPVIWLVKGKAKVPWGQRVQLN